MSETDKFEFKNLPHLSVSCLRHGNKHKNSLLEYKQLIMELYEAVNSLNKELEQTQNLFKAEQTKSTSIHGQLTELQATS